MHDLLELIDKLEQQHTLTPTEFTALIDGRTPKAAEYLFSRAREVRHAVYGHDIYIRGLIEFTNYCKNDCYYCGIRKSNLHPERYRLTADTILGCCRHGYELGFRTFVLQGGEDPWYLASVDKENCSSSRMTALIQRIKDTFPDCALTISFGEHTKDIYQEWFDAGADRYLLRHETADALHYSKLHPAQQTLRNRRQCLLDLKEIGYQTGSGFMVGSPGQTTECLIKDLLFLQELKPHMIGIGPFIPHQDTPFAKETAGSLELTLFLLGILRLMFPHVLLPATTALGTIDPDGRKLGILAGANVVMPNLSPQDVRKNYMLYDNKLHTGSEAAEALEQLTTDMLTVGYQITVDRGDCRLPKF